MKGEALTLNPKDIVLQVSSWREFFTKHESRFRQSTCIVALGGTLDSRPDVENELAPYPHPNTISATRGLKALDIKQRFKDNAHGADKLGNLYIWADSVVPWSDVSLRTIERVSSYDSGQEGSQHFLAELAHAYDLFENGADVVHISSGTDSLAKKVALGSALFTRYLKERNKKLVFVGSAQSGFQDPELAGANITGALYVGLEDQLSGGVYTVSAHRVEDEVGEAQVYTHVFEGLSSVKLHSDGLFHAPNAGPLLTVWKDSVYKTPHFDDMKIRDEQVGLLPDFAEAYLKDPEGLSRLEKIFSSLHIDTVENDSDILDSAYEKGKRVFVLRTRGSGNGPPEWREAIEKIINKGDTTCLLITSADRGVVDLKKYAAGLDVPGVLSGLALREEAAAVLAAICHDHKINAHDTLEWQQQLITRLCYVAGIA